MDFGLREVMLGNDQLQYDFIFLVKKLSYEPARL